MRCTVLAYLGAAWAVLGLATAGAWAQSSCGGYPEGIDEPQGTFETATNNNAVLEEVRQLRERVSALEAQDGKKKETQPPVDDCGPFCCDGKPAKLVPLRPNAVKLGGRIFWDNYCFDQDDGHRAIVGDQRNSTGFDATRLSAAGNLWENVEFEAEMDFADVGPAHEVKWKNVFIQVVELPVINAVKAGHFKEPFSIEELTSARFITFMERSMPNNAFVPARNEGVMIGGYLGDYKDLSWWTGMFISEDDDEPPGISQDKNHWASTTRVAWLPYYDEGSDGRYLVHVGSAFTYRNFGDGNVIYSARPELGGGTAPDPTRWLIVDLSAFDAFYWNAEAAVVWGPLSVQAEYFASQANTTVGADKNYHGWYAQVSYFLTGEHREYHRGNKAFYRAHPHENAWWVDTIHGWCFGRGAWEVAARWSFLDLQDGGGAAVRAGQEGEMQNFTAGINWYLNPHCRLMFNYIHNDLERIDGREGEADMFATRFQVDW